jgi:hypothetical protein
VFDRARESGLHSVPHAGETVGPGEVWSAVRELGAERIGHGPSRSSNHRFGGYRMTTIVMSDNPGAQLGSSSKRTRSMLDGRRDDSMRERRRVLAAIDQAASAGDRLSASAIALELMARLNTPIQDDGWVATSGEVPQVLVPVARCPLFD